MPSRSISIAIFAIYFVLASILHSTEGVTCIQCAYIEGVDSWDLNKDCASDKVMEKIVQSEDGVACVKAEGFINGKSFIVRQAFLPDVKTPPVGFPKGQSALSCEDYRVKSYGVAKVTKVSDYKVDTVTSCTLCNNHDDCNAAGSVSAGLFGLSLTAAVLISKFL